MTKIKNFRIHLRPREIARWLKKERGLETTPDLEMTIEQGIKEANALDRTGGHLHDAHSANRRENHHSLSAESDRRFGGGGLHRSGAWKRSVSGAAGSLRESRFSPLLNRKLCLNLFSLLFGSSRSRPKKKIVKCRLHRFGPQAPHALALIGDASRRSTDRNSVGCCANPSFLLIPAWRGCSGPLWVKERPSARRKSLPKSSFFATRLLSFLACLSPFCRPPSHRA